MDIEQMVITIVEEHLRASVSDELDASIFDRFGADDLDGLEILMEIEEQFGIEIPDDDYETTQAFIDVTMKLVSGDE